MNRRYIPLWLALVMALGILLIGCPASDDDDDDDDGTDTDGDGLTDAEEADLGTDPTVADTDEDGLDDGFEVALGTDPLSTDSDGDGLGDGEEVEIGTDPVSMDTDGDTFIDPLEINENFDPLDGSDVPYAGFYYGRDTCYQEYATAVYGEGDVLSDFALTDQFGDTVRLSDFCGRVIYIECGADW